MTLLEGKVVWITGAKLESGEVGIGGATARAVVKQGARVVLLNRTLETAQALADELNGGAGAHVAGCVKVDLQVDRRLQEAVDRAMSEFGRVDALINNAAPTQLGRTDLRVLEVEVETWDAIYALNVRAPFLLVKHVLPHMLEIGGGAILNVSSTSSLAGDVFRTAYGSSKAALNMFSLYVATQYGRDGIRCNVLIPGLTSTGNVKAHTSGAASQAIARQVLRSTLNTPEDLANVAAFLVSPASAGINGEMIRVDAGAFCHTPYALDLHEVMYQEG